jgi:hypothetical protein
MKRKIALEIISFLFILLFVYAATNKLADIERFQIQIGQSPLLTDIAPIVAWIIPGLELAISMLFVWTRFRAIAMYGAFALMVMFTAYIGAILTLSEEIPCACGGVLDTLGWKEHLIFNIGFVLLALCGILLNPTLTSDEVISAQKTGDLRA